MVSRGYTAHRGERPKKKPGFPGSNDLAVSFFLAFHDGQRTEVGGAEACQFANDAIDSFSDQPPASRVGMGGDAVGGAKPKGFVSELFHACFQTFRV